MPTPAQASNSESGLVPALIPQDEVKSTIPVRFTQVLLILLMLYGSTSVFGAVRIIFPVHFKEIGHISLLGWALGMFPLMALLFSVPFGAISDRFSPKKLIIGATMLMALFPLGLHLQLGVVYDFIFLGLGGISNAILVSVGPSLYMKLISEENKTIKLGLLSFFQTLAWGTGLFAVMVFSGATDPIAVFKFLAIGGALFVIPTFFIPDAKPFKFSFSAYRKDVLNRPSLMFLTLVFAMSFHFGLEGVGLPLFIEDALKVDKKLFTILFAGFSAYMAFVGIWLSVRFNRPELRGCMFFFGLLAASVSNIAVYWISDINVFLAWRMLHLLGDAAFFLSSKLIIDCIFDKRKLGGPFGLVTMVSFGATWIGMQVSNAFVQYGDLRTPFALAGLLPILLVIYVLLFYPKLGSYKYGDLNVE